MTDSDPLDPLNLDALLSTPEEALRVATLIVLDHTDARLLAVLDTQQNPEPTAQESLEGLRMTQRLADAADAYLLTTLAVGRVRRKYDPELLQNALIAIGGVIVPTMLHRKMQMTKPRPVRDLLADIYPNEYVSSLKAQVKADRTRDSGGDFEDA